MALQWTFVASFMYVEIGVVIILLLPFVSPGRWQKIFRSKIATSVSGYSHIYFNVFIAILLLLFVDSIREVHKYTSPSETVDLKHNPDAEHLAMMKLFRAQRNFYISGFALFLWFIIRRLLTLINEEAKLAAQCEAYKKQAESATAAAKRLMEEKDNSDNQDKDKKYEDLDPEEKNLAVKLDQTKEQLVKTKEELKKTKVDLETLKSQATSTNNEYDRLLKEHEKLQQKLDTDDSKKDK
ncbi:B-cell receptor-associated protein 31-like [Crassostrea virginica]|uniref:Endoplasmic reticulum transmembrane protein n=1 Tax=Crassostrea virginica TaxID=6565 RepID=A0A8B8AXR6_CRAVI|nr:B-cell receptor-associated protein 31-like [Crassostrea virginica]XP_022295965.1 B-cell receptor-associated protein 31-like [Crassostrea virginica]XP_022298003.1 B-cell receptor-associated protein 31-like [Crassostrea virginica]